MALHGLGGVGKTQIALEYAYRHALEYSAVFWIGAETGEQIVASLLHIAEVLQLPGRDDKDQQRVITVVQRWFAMHEQWLLIWDNVEDLALLDRFLPSIRSGAILITTRCQALGTLARSLDLPPMKHEEGTLFLLRRAKMLDPQATSEQVRQFAARTPAHYAAAADLVTTMGGLPLALDQTGAYLEETHCGLPAYLDLFRNRGAVLLQQRGEGSRDHPASVSATFTLALTAITQRHPAVRDLLQISALLQPDAIPEKLFRQGGEHLGPRLEAVCSDELEWDRVVGVACSYSLLSRQPEEQTLSIHRLVQAVLLDTMSEGEQEQWNRRVIEALDAVFPEIQISTAYALRKQCDRLLPHILLCLHQANASEESLALSSLAYKTAKYLRERGLYAEAEPLYLRALHIRERVWGPDHPDTALDLDGLAFLYYRLGRYEQAEPLYLRVLRIQERASGPEHPKTASALNGLAILYCNQRKYAEAESLFQRVLRIQERASGPEHHEVARPLNNLAELYRIQGKYAEAEPLYLRALRFWEQALGPEHPDVAYPLHNLAELYREQSKGAEAEPLYLRALHIWEQALGVGHPYLAEPLNGLADLYREQDRYREAEAFYHRALSTREQQLGQHHPETAETLHDMALLRQKQGRLSEARSFAKRAFSIRSQSQGDAHPKTIATQALYEQLLQEQAGAKGEAASERHPEAIPDPRENERHEDGVSSPLHKAVTLAPSEDDPLQAFLNACCELYPLAWCRISELWQAYEQWTVSVQKCVPLSRRAFAAQLKARRCRTDRTSTARIWRGIRLMNKNP